ncbi:MAG: hypothetical protein M3Q58_10725 [Bacteroidota bacterium]|nr:hypothetical protein [Bacteroidota bacterium]
MRLSILFLIPPLLGLFFVSTCLGQDEVISIKSERIVSKGLNFLQSTQQLETLNTTYFKGEWSSYITNQNYFPLFMKKGKTAYDSNCFTTSTVHNLLAEIYLSNPEYIIIPEMLDRALDNIMLYQNKETFNFWHFLPRVEHLQKKKHIKDPEKYMQHRPNNFVFKSRFMNRCANICNDADDTALSFTAMKLNKQVKEKSMLFPQMLVPDSIGHYFSSYRNIKRGKSHLYNTLFGKRKNLKGAFCTWFGKETKFTLLTFHPVFSKQKKYIPYNANEVDCIVNANTLLALQHYNELETPGAKEAINMLNNSVKTTNCNYCGIYYPSEYTLHYIISQLIEKGMTDFNEQIPVMLHRLKKNQHEDGSWRTKIKGNELQVSLYALITMCNIGQVEKHNTLPYIEKAMAFVYSQAIETDELVYWPGGVFFSGGTVIRDSFLWRSDAVTTALALTAILKYEELKVKLADN